MTEEETYGQISLAKSDILNLLETCTPVSRDFFIIKMSEYHDFIALIIIL